MREPPRRFCSGTSATALFFSDHGREYRGFPLEMPDLTLTAVTDAVLGKKTKRLMFCGESQKIIVLPIFGHFPAFSIKKGVSAFEKRGKACIFL